MRIQWRHLKTLTKVLTFVSSKITDLHDRLESGKIVRPRKFLCFMPLNRSKARARFVFPWPLKAHDLWGSGEMTSAAELRGTCARIFKSCSYHCKSTQMMWWNNVYHTSEGQYSEYTHMQNFQKSLATPLSKEWSYCTWKWTKKLCFCWTGTKTWQACAIGNGILIDKSFSVLIGGPPQLRKYITGLGNGGIFLQYFFRKTAAPSIGLVCIINDIHIPFSTKASMSAVARWHLNCLLYNPYPS